MGNACSRFTDLKLCLYRQLVSIHPLGSKLPVETKGCNLVTRLTHVGSWFTFMGQSSAANYFHSFGSLGSFPAVAFLGYILSR